MKKVIIFLLTAAIAIGCIGFAHAAVTDSQDEVFIYPIVEIGDSSILEGRTLSQNLYCGQYLRWHTEYTFGGETEAEFTFRPEVWTDDTTEVSFLDIYFTGGMGASVSGGSFNLQSTDYGAMFRSVAAAVPDGESRTMNLNMADYVEYYLPDFDLRYEDEALYCQESSSLYGKISGDAWYEEDYCYNDLIALFRFPVQDNHIMAVTVGKSTEGQIQDIEMWPENGPTLKFISDVTAEGIWFTPIFQAEDGTPLDYEAPQDHGIYFAPWKQMGTTTGGGEPDKAIVSPDMSQLKLVLPLDASLQLLDMVIDAQADRAWMLTLEADGYIVTACDLEAGEFIARTPALPHDAEAEDSYSEIIRDDGFLLIHAQGNLALYAESTDTLALTAPYDHTRTFCPRWYNPTDGEIHYDGEYLILVEAAYYRDGAFFANVFRQGQEVFYGEYDCSLLRGNDDWYYAYILPDRDPVALK